MGPGIWHPKLEPATEALKKGNFSEAIQAAAGPAILGLTGIVAEDLAEGAGVVPIPKGRGPAGGGDRRPGLIETTQEQLREGASGNNQLLLRIAEGVERNQIVEADITTNLQLDGNTIDTITQKTSSGAAERTKDDMRRKSQGLPTTRPW